MHGRARRTRSALSLMSRQNRELATKPRSPTSIEAREGRHDRDLGIGSLAHHRGRPSIRPMDQDDIVTPGHVFPLIAQRRRRPGACRPYRGVGRYRAPRRAQPVGCHLRDHERRRHHGAAATTWSPFAQFHGLKIAYHRRSDRLPSQERQAHGRTLAGDATSTRRLGGEFQAGSSMARTASTTAPSTWRSGQGRHLRAPSRCWSECTRSISWTTCCTMKRGGQESGEIEAAIFVIDRRGRSRRGRADPRYLEPAVFQPGAPAPRIATWIRTWPRPRFPSRTTTRSRWGTFRVLRDYRRRRPDPARSRCERDGPVDQRTRATIVGLDGYGLKVVECGARSRVLEI